jgi:hypothetical protein
MFRNGCSISHAGETAESTTSARSPVASSTKPGNECWPRNRSPRRKIYKRQSIASFKAAWRPSGGQADGRSSSQAARRRIAMAFGWRGSIHAGLVEFGSRRPCTQTRRKDTISPPTSTIVGESPKAMLKPRRTPIHRVTSFLPPQAAGDGYRPHLPPSRRRRLGWRLGRVWYRAIRRRVSCDRLGNR